MKTQTDLRVIKTKKALVDAMVQSLREKPFEDITVQYICDIAMVRRATFYSHFADKYELFGYAVHCVYQEFPSTKDLKTAADAKDVYTFIIEDAINFLTENTMIFRSMMNSQLSHMILNIVRSELEREILPFIEESIKRYSIQGITPKFVFNFYLNGLFGTFMWWLREGCPISKEELIVQTQRMLKL